MDFQVYSLGDEHVEPADITIQSEKEWVPTPEDFRPSPRKPRGRLRTWPALNQNLPATLLLALAAVLSILRWSGKIIDISIWGERFFAGEYWRALSALFLHADLGHLLSNAFLFLVFGTLLKAYFGWVAFPILPLVAGVVSNTLVAVTYDSQVRLMGLSGMIYAMVAMWLVFYMHFEDQRSLPQKISRAVGFALLMLLPQTYDPRVSYLAHGYGFLAGLVLAFISVPYLRLRDPR